MLRRLADVKNPDSLANAFRMRRFERFTSLTRSWPRPLRIIDIGGTNAFWEQMGWAGRDDVFIVLVNHEPEPSRHANITPTVGDATNLSDIPTNAFDVALSNSVIEHLFSRDAQAAMARAMRRVAPSMWLQTPNFWFPMEPHFHVPGWQWMPSSVRRAIIRRRRCGWRGPCPNEEEADRVVSEVRLLTRSELATLFPGAQIVAERWAGLAKSWIVIDGFDTVPAQREAA